jgi:hypothetical protein
MHVIACNCTHQPSYRELYNPDLNFVLYRRHLKAYTECLNWKFFPRKDDVVFRLSKLSWSVVWIALVNYYLKTVSEEEAVNERWCCGIIELRWQHRLSYRKAALAARNWYSSWPPTDPEVIWWPPCRLWRHLLPKPISIYVSPCHRGGTGVSKRRRLSCDRPPGHYRITNARGEESANGLNRDDYDTMTSLSCSDLKFQ